MVTSLVNIFKASRIINETPELSRRTVLTNFIITACFIVNVIGWIFDYFVAYSEQLMLLDLVGVIFYGGLFIYHWMSGKQVVSASLLFVSLLLYIGYTACYFGPDAFMILYMYNLIIIAFFIFDVKSWLFGCMIVSAMVSIYMLEVNNYDFVEALPLSPSQVKDIRFFCISANLVLFIVTVIIIDRNIRQMEVALISDRIKVEEMSQRLQMLCSLKEEYNTSLLNQLDSLLINRNDLQSVSSISSLRSEERERARIGKELSQSVGEILLKIKLKMGNLSTAISANDRPDFEEALRVIDLASEEITKFSEILDPMEFSKLRLDEALRVHIKNLKNKTGLALDFLNVGYTNQLAKEQELVVFRVVSDMLREVIDKAKASKCDLRLEVVENYMTIRIQDNGAEYSEQERELFFEDFAFQERVQVIGGFVHSKTEIFHGSTTLIEIPVPDSTFSEIDDYNA